MTKPVDTIAAQATPPGRGGVGIIRVSGPQSRSVAEAIVGHCPPPRFAHYGPFHGEDGSVLDMGLALYFPAPHSFTGEDVLELHGHGGPVILDLLLKQVLALGPRLAAPGEFSQRAFLNDKLDLAQAEAVADLIDSATEAAARSALRSLAGEFSARIHALLEQLIQLRLYVESAMDFPEEEIDFLSDTNVQSRLDQLAAEVSAVPASARQGSLLREGMNVVILGRPNAGKSSLLNALAGRDTAIVTDIPGTTRDVLREQIQIDGMPLHIVDTAGLREAGDAVEEEGIRRAWAAVEKADRLLLMVDDSDAEGPAEAAILDQLPAGAPLTVVHNKIDLSGNPAREAASEQAVHLWLSARSGEGLEALRAHLKGVMGFQSADQGTFLARRRHLDALERAAAAVERGRNQLQAHAAGELLAEDLRDAQAALGEITGEFDNEDLLDRIFSSFCIGK